MSWMVTICLRNSDGYPTIARFQITVFKCVKFPGYWIEGTDLHCKSQIQSHQCWKDPHTFPYTIVLVHPEMCVYPPISTAADSLFKK